MVVTASRNAVTVMDETRVSLLGIRYQIGVDAPISCFATGFCLGNTAENPFLFIVKFDLKDTCAQSINTGGIEQENTNLVCSAVLRNVE